jgi:hypothetical protein
VTRGEPRSRPFDQTPREGSSCFRRFARPRYRIDRPTSHGLRRGSRECAVGIDVHGPLDRAKDVSSKMEALFRRLPGRVRALDVRHADHVPLLGICPEGTCCHRCGRLPGNEPLADETDRPRPMFLRQPAKADGTRWIRVPSTARDHGLLRRSLLTGSRVGLPFTPPTRRPALAGAEDDMPFRGALQASLPGEPDGDFERAGRLCILAGSRAWA